MKEKELRLALVCYGGVSLALYEHGITKEILSLVRASRACQTRTDDPPALGQGEAGGTAEIYFDLLKAFGATLDLRVVVDVIAGSSAGGINGVALARALAHDLSLEPLTDMWLAEADIQRLLAPEAKARQWSKWYFQPLINPLLWRLRREGLIPADPDVEMRSALSTFLRSRWFHPPLDGPGFSALLLDGLKAMGDGRSEAGSLAPVGHPLDLVVTVTDFYGAARTIFVHDPPVIHEREHRHVLRFSYEHPAGGAAHSDFSGEHVPSLAFAARATASYPGAFPPAQLREMDQLLSKRGESWPGRGQFIAANFRHYLDAGLAPETAVLVDGSVLNNKPLSEAIAVIRTHRAFREVDRRLVYIDPHPFKQSVRARKGRPGFFATLRGALSDLPRNEPIYDELAEINAFNDQVRQRRAVVEAARDQIAALVAQITEGGLDRPVDTESVRRWRMSGARQLGAAGPVANGWIRLMIEESVKFVTRLIGDACGYPPTSPRLRWIEEAVEAWVRRVGMLESFIHPPVSREADLPAFGRFMANFGVAYKRRRISFVIQATNTLYHRAEEPDLRVDPTALDVLKRRLYRSLDSLRIYDDAQFLSAELGQAIQAIFGGLPEVTAGVALPDPEVFVETRQEAISVLLEHLSQECDLVALNDEVDAILTSPTAAALGVGGQRELLTSYLGYHLWDLLLLPMVTTGGAGAAVRLEEIFVDRISPEDASLRLEGEGPILRGGALAGFGGFFSRSTRENDYLWGRLHAIDRLLDLLASTAAKEIASAGIDIAAFKKRSYACVLKEEAPRLSHVRELISQLEAAVSQL